MYHLGRFKHYCRPTSPMFSRHIAAILDGASLKIIRFGYRIYDQRCGMQGLQLKNQSDIAAITSASSIASKPTKKELA